MDSTPPLEATSELDGEIKKFRTPFAQEVGNNGETVTYSLRSRNAFACSASTRMAPASTLTADAGTENPPHHFPILIVAGFSSGLTRYTLQPARTAMNNLGYSSPERGILPWPSGYEEAK